MKVNSVARMVDFAAPLIYFIGYQRLKLGYFIFNTCVFVSRGPMEIFILVYYLVLFHHLLHLIHRHFLFLVPPHINFRYFLLWFRYLLWFYDYAAVGWIVRQEPFHSWMHDTSYRSTALTTLSHGLFLRETRRRVITITSLKLHIDLTWFLKQANAIVCIIEIKHTSELAWWSLIIHLI